MRAKDFKKLLEGVSDETLILFDDGCGTFYPVRTIEDREVMTDDKPGDPNVSFIDARDFAEFYDVEDMKDVAKFNAKIFSLEDEIERMTDDIEWEDEDEDEVE